MDNPSAGADSAFIRKLRSKVVHMDHFLTARAFRPGSWQRPTLENVKTVISVSLDLVRTALACAVALRGWAAIAA
jgi:hypothetical protein